MKPVERRIESSSSTMLTTRFSSIKLLRLRPYQSKMELCTAPLCWLHPNAAAIGLDDSSTNRKTKPHAFRFRAHERLEELGCDVRRYARPGVSHRHANKSRLIGRRPDREQTRSEEHTTEIQSLMRLP